MIIPLAPLILGVVAWLGSKAIPAVWHHHISQPTKIQVELSKDLCEKHNDCEAEKTWAMPVKELHDTSVKGTIIKNNNSN